MTTLNKAAAEVMNQVGVSACTDVPFDKLILQSLRSAGVLTG